MPSDGAGSPNGGNHECVHCSGPATHKHAKTGEYLCCGHASIDIDAKPVRDGHECVKFYTVSRLADSRGLECEHRDNPNPPTGDLVPCHETAVWDIVTSHFPGFPFAPDHPGAPTTTSYCPEHFAGRLDTIVESSGGKKLEVRPRDW